MVQQTLALKEVLEQQYPDVKLEELIGAIEYPNVSSYYKTINIVKLWYSVGYWDMFLSELCLGVIRIPVDDIKSKESKVDTLKYVNEKYEWKLKVSKRSQDNHIADAVMVAEVAAKICSDPANTEGN